MESKLGSSSSEELGLGKSAGDRNAEDQAHVGERFCAPVLAASAAAAPDDERGASSNLGGKGGGFVTARRCVIGSVTCLSGVILVPSVTSLQSVRHEEPPADSAL
jgi:hypothetical protein